MASRNDEGQVILLAGILLVLAFILFATQLSVLATLGQQAGREIENPILDDYLLLRRTIDALLVHELRGPPDAKACPADLFDYGSRVAGQLLLLSSQQSDRGHSLRIENLTVADAPGGFHVGVNLTLGDGRSQVRDHVSYAYACSGTPVPAQRCAWTQGMRSARCT